MDIVALAGGIGAGKFLRGLCAGTAHEVTVVVNTGDDITPYGLHVSPDVDSVIYWLSGAGDRERGWGRGNETFRATEELRERFAADEAWFGLGDLDLATNLFRTGVLRAGGSLSDATAAIAERFGVAARIVPMSDDRVTTRIVTADGTDLHFQEYWVRDGATADVAMVRYDGAASARPAPGVLEALGSADAVIICPSNPVASIAPILAVPGIAEVLAARSETVVGISPIVGGAPLRGMADKLMPAAGLEVTAMGAARAYRGVAGAWVIDQVDASLKGPIEDDLDMRVGVTDTVMPEDNDGPAIALADVALDMVRT